MRTICSGQPLEYYYDIPAPTTARYAVDSDRTPDAPSSPGVTCTRQKQRGVYYNIGLSSQNRESPLRAPEGSSKMSVAVLGRSRRAVSNRVLKLAYLLPRFCVLFLARRLSSHPSSSSGSSPLLSLRTSPFPALHHSLSTSSPTT